jgi:hypothetical protein
MNLPAEEAQCFVDGFVERTFANNPNPAAAAAAKAKAEKLEAPLEPPDGAAT